MHQPAGGGGGQRLAAAGAAEARFASGARPAAIAAEPDSELGANVGAGTAGDAARWTLRDPCKVGAAVTGTGDCARRLVIRRNRIPGAAGDGGDGQSLARTAGRGAARDRPHLA